MHRNDTTLLNSPGDMRLQLMQHGMVVINGKDATNSVSKQFFGQLAGAATAICGEDTVQMVTQVRKQIIVKLTCDVNIRIAV
jgi:hypothetical protein